MLLKTLMQGHQELVLSATISPTVLQSDEVEFLEGQISYCEGYRDAYSIRSHSTQPCGGFGAGIAASIPAVADAPYYMTFSVGSDEEIDSMLLEFIGLAITEPIGQGIPARYPTSSFSFHAGGYDIVYPLTDEDYKIARDNLATLAQNPWNRTHVHPEMSRFRFLFDGNEAASAFYFPINTAENLPGIETHHLDELPIPRAMLKLTADEDSAIHLGNHYFGFKQDVLLSESSRSNMPISSVKPGRETTLMKTMILSDMKAGKGLCVVIRMASLL